MVSSEIRAEARKSLAGKWGKGALLTLVFMVITFIISWVLNLIPFVGSIANFVISPVLAFGYLIGFIKLKRGEEVGYLDFFKNGFNFFGKVWGVIGQTILKMIVPVIALIVSIVILFIGVGGITASSIYGNSSSGLSFLAIIGFIAYISSLTWVIVKSFSYVLSQYILYDNPDMDSKAIVEKSEELMVGHKWAYFWLPITFIGWVILSAFTLYIGLLWVIPYMQVALVIFYENLAGNTTSAPINEEDKPEDNEPISE